MTDVAAAVEEAEAETAVQENNANEDDNCNIDLIPEQLENHTALTVNKRFFVNTLKQIGDHNRIKSNQESKLLRKFQNEERKKHTLKNLNASSSQKTLYSDFVEPPEEDKTRSKAPVERTKIISPFEQVKQLVKEAAQFDAQAEKKDMLNRVVRKSRFSLDKRLLNNHLKHTSVHNRLKEEQEMWDVHSQSKNKKGVGLRTKKFASGHYGGMYSDREPGNVKVTRVKETPDEEPPSPPRFGKATRKLLDLEESMPDRWGHRGFKDTYMVDNDSDELEDDSDSESSDDITEIDKEKMKLLTRKIVISSKSKSVTARLHNSIQLSDDEKEVKSKRRTKLGSRVVLNKLNDSPRKIIGVRKPVAIKKKSIIKVAPKPSKIKIDNSRKSLKGIVRKKKIPVKSTRVGTLQADLIVAEQCERNRRNPKRELSPKWEHDGFEEINDEEDVNSGTERTNVSRILRTVDVEEGDTPPVTSKLNQVSNRKDDNDSAEPVRKGVKSRLRTIQLDDNDDSDSSLKIVTSKRARAIQVTKNNSVNKNNTSISNGRKRKISLQLSEDSDEWTERKIPRNDKRAELKQDKNRVTEVNRATLKSSIHEEKADSNKSRMILSTQKATKTVETRGKSGGNVEKCPAGNNIERKRTSSKNHGDSSFTDSSGDERYKKNMDLKKKRDRKFYQPSGHTKR